MRIDSIFLGFQGEAQRNPMWNWYAIADNAQQAHLHTMLVRQNGRACCLFGGAPGTPIAQLSPHLVELEKPYEKDKAWRWVLNNMGLSPCVSIIATDQDFDSTFDKMASLAEVEMPDRDHMFLAYWDPAILGSLVGQQDDLTLHVKGPVLSSEQIEHLTFKLKGWWYWSRDQKLHEIDMRGNSGGDRNNLLLTAKQVDDLVEVSVPDQILYHLHRYQSSLINTVPARQRYDFIRRAISRGRVIGLESMSDLVTYVCVELIYKEKIHSDEAIGYALEQVSLKKKPLSAALMEL